MENIFKFILIFLSLIVAVNCDETKCQACKELVEGILKGLDKTKHKNFEGGDVHWEEKNLGKYKNSETRLIEVLDWGCSKGSFKCNSLKEEYEEAIEEWFKKKRDQESLHDVLCVKESKSCCPDGHFGKECEKCPQTDAGKICSGRGSCKGDGDTEGTGECECDAGFKGETCDECADNYYETSRNDTHLICEQCHPSCRSCKNNETTGCVTCMDGYREKENIDNEDEKECIDIDECSERDNLCVIGKYCSNTNGSYECKDIDECASGAVCLGMYEVCVNTFGHYRCECARNFRRSPQTGQCQPDPGVFPGMFNHAAEEEQQRQSEPSSNGGAAADSDIQDSLSDDDIARLVIAVVMCILGTMAASGSIKWNLIFFFALILLALWWASDKSDKILATILKMPQDMQHQLLGHQEL